MPLSRLLIVLALGLGVHPLPGAGQAPVPRPPDASSEEAAPLTAPGLTTAEPTLILQRTIPVRGRVVDSEGTPIPGARVILARFSFRSLSYLAGAPTTGEDAHSTLTDESGAFHFSGSPAEELDVIVRAPGFASRLLRRVEARPAAEGGEEVDLGTLVLEPGISIEGRVVDEEGRPVEGAAVFVLMDGTASTVRITGGRFLPVDQRPPSALSAPDGTFTVTDLPADEPRSVWARREGFVAGDPLRIELPQDAEITMVLERMGTFRGVVVDPSGRAVSGATVDGHWIRRSPVRTMSNRRDHSSVSTDAEGRFQFHVPYSVTGHFQAKAPGWAASELTSVEMTEESADDTIRLVLRPAGTVEGRVTTPSGRPVEGAGVSIHRLSARTDLEGRYRLEGVLVGPAEAHARHGAHGTKQQEVEVRPGVTALDWVLSDGDEEKAYLKGTVRNAAGEPVAGAEVTVTVAETSDPRHRGGYGRKTVSQAGGEFVLEPIPPGLYTVHAKAEGHASSTTAEAVEVTEAGVEGVVIVLAEGARLKGSVLGLSPEEAATLEIVAYGPEMQLRATLVDPNGRFEIEALEPGAWSLMASTAGDRRRTSASVVIEPGASRVVQDLEFRSGLVLSGTVRLEGEPLGGAVLRARGEATGSHGMADADYLGNFEILDLRPDTYELEITHGARQLYFTERVEVDFDRHVSLDLYPAGLAGRVVDAASGEGIAGAELTLELGGGQFSINRSSGAEGSFRFGPLAPGSYVLDARKDGWSRYRWKNVIEPGDQLEAVEVPLRSEHH